MPSNDETNNPSIEPTLHSVNEAIENWRRTKSGNGGHSMPDSLWQQIFLLAESYTAKKVRHFFSLSKTQYDSKFKKLFPPSEPPREGPTTPESSGSKDTDFCEVTIQPTDTVPSLSDVAHTTSSSIQQLKSNKSDPSTYLDYNTIIVECIRPDGQRLKIHTVQKNVDQILTAFFNNHMEGSINS